MIIENTVNRNPIIPVQISNTNQTKLKALIDSGADVCVIKSSVLNKYAIINSNEIISLSGFSSNKIYTFGTFMAEIILNNKTFQQIFHVVPEYAKMNDIQVILGKDFLNNNGIIIDFGKGILYTNPDNIKITSKPNLKSILRNKDINNLFSLEEKIKEKSKSQSPPHDIYFDPEVKGEDDILYADNKGCIDIAKVNFNEKILKELKENSYKILLGCTRGQLFCNSVHQVSDVNRINAMKIHCKKSITNKISKEIVKSKNSRVESNSQPRQESIERELLNLPSTSKNLSEIGNANHSNKLNIMNSKNLVVTFKPNSDLHVSNINEVIKNDKIKIQKCINPSPNQNTPFEYDYYDYYYDYYYDNKPLVDCLSDRRRPILNPSSSYAHLNEEVSLDPKCMVVNSMNFGKYILSIYNEILKFENCLRNGTNLKNIINNFNMINDTIVEIRKFLFDQRARIHESNLNFKTKMGNILVNFKDIVAAVNVMTT